MTSMTNSAGRETIRSRPPKLGELLARRDEVLRICARHGARNVRVLGTVARGEARDDSDLDLLVDLEDCRSLFNLVELVTDLEHLFGCPVDVGTEVKGRCRKRVEAEAVAL